jgi:hypothetical protein
MLLGLLIGFIGLFYKQHMTTLHVLLLHTHPSVHSNVFIVAT